MSSLIGKVARTIRNDSPVPLTAPRRGGARLLPVSGTSAMTTQLQAIEQVSTLFSIVDRIANAVGQVDWHLYRKQADARRVTAPGQEKQRTEVIRHPALDLWDNPNPFYGRDELVETLDQHYELTGEMWLVVGRQPRADLPLELWPIRPDRMEPVPHARKFIAGYLYTGPDGEQVPLELNQVIYVRRPSPLDPYRGISAVGSSLVDLESARAAAEWNRAFFRNSAEPGGVIELEQRLEDNEWDEFVERWREQHQGIGNAHRVAVIEQGKWVERKYTMRDMQFAELRGVSREVLREAFGIHPHMLGITEDVNKANAYAGEAHFARWLVTPRARRLRSMLNRQLLKLYGPLGEAVEFDHGRIVPEDREADDRERTSRAQAAQLLRIGGWDPDDILEAVGLPPMRFAGDTDRDNNLATDA